MSSFLEACALKKAANVIVVVVDVDDVQRWLKLARTHSLPLILKFKKRDTVAFGVWNESVMSSLLHLLLLSSFYFWRLQLTYNIFQSVAINAQIIAKQFGSATATWTSGNSKISFWKQCAKCILESANQEKVGASNYELRIGENIINKKVPDVIEEIYSIKFVYAGLE